LFDICTGFVAVDLFLNQDDMVVDNAMGASERRDPARPGYHTPVHQIPFEHQQEIFFGHTLDSTQELS
jgi:hypothetical protein